MPDTTLVEIVVSSHDAQASADFANAFCEEYIQLSRAENRGQLQAALDYVSRQKASVGERVNAARNIIGLCNIVNCVPKERSPPEPDALLTKVDTSVPPPPPPPSLSTA